MNKKLVTKKITKCRVCKSSNLVDLYSLGNQYINNFIKKDDLHKCIKAPLTMVFCNKCTLVQLKHNAPQELLYSGYYWYRSGVTSTMKIALKDIVKDIYKKIKLSKNDIVLDLGSNDGTLLRAYKRKNLITVGFEPAKNLLKEGKKGIDYFFNDFWDFKIFQNKFKRKAKVITAIGMFYDMEDPNKFINDASKALDKNGIFVAQLMCLKNMLDSNDVGNICHEHLEYYSLKSLDYLFNKNNMEIFDISINNINGGSYRIYARNIDSKVDFKGSKIRLNKIRKIEKNINNISIHKNFYNRIVENKKKCINFINKELKKGKKIWIYGASTKGNVILQFYELSKKQIISAAERSPWKWGKYTVGSMIKCVSEVEARKAQPDYFLVLPYAFFDEFYNREKKWRARGGKFIVPIPKFKVIK